MLLEGVAHKARTGKLVFKCENYNVQRRMGMTMYL